MPAAFDFVEDTTEKSFDFQADPIPTPDSAPTISPTAQLAKARLAFAPIAGQAVANLPDRPLITLPEWPKGEGSLEEQITGQVYGKLKDFLGFMTSPKGAAVTGAAIAAPEVAGPIISAAMLPAAVEEGIGTVKSIGKGDIPGAAGHATGLALTGAGVLGGLAQFLPRTVAEARVPAKLEKGPAPGTQRTRTGTVTIERSDIPTPSRVPTKEAIPIQSETPFTPLTPQEESALKAQAEPEPLLQADVDRLFLDKLNEESNREIEAASAQPKPTPLTPAEQAEARADLAAELGEEPKAPVAPEPAPAPETPPAISAPEAKAPEPTPPVKVEAPAAKEPTFEGMIKDAKTPEDYAQTKGVIENSKNLTIPQKQDYLRRLYEEHPDLAPEPAAKPAAETGKQMGVPYLQSESGEPLTVLHGTPETGFNPSEIEYSEWGHTGPGIYFTTDPRVAQTYSTGHGATTGRILKAKIISKRPFGRGTFTEEEAAQMNAALVKNGYTPVKKLAGKTHEWLLERKQEQAQDTWDSVMKDAGYDAVYVPNWEENELVVYDPKQIVWEKESATPKPKPPETPPTGPGMAAPPASPEARLSQSLQSVPKQKPPPQGPAAQPMGITPFPGLVTGLQKVAQSAQRVWHEIADVPKFAPFKRVINKFNADTQRTSLKIRQMQADIESRVPDPKRLEAITNWLQADGDVAKLQAWEAASKTATRRQGYRDAQRLTPYEVQVAQAIRQYYDDLLARGQAYGILDQAKDDYVTQIWKRPLLGGAQFAQFASKLSRTFKFGMKSVFENFFEGEQAGFKPVTKNISKLLGVYVSELEKTIATRDMIRDLTHETASDGNPLAKVEGTAHIAQDQAGDPTGPMFVRPGVVKGDVRYAELNHPALKNWKWISKDPESGRDVFILGELRVHPEIRRHLSNVLSQSQIRKWMREPSESELVNILKLAARFGDTTSRVVKQVMLGTLSYFHHVQEGTHGVGHRANAFLPPKLPVGTPELNYALDHGLQLAAEGAALENFREGLGSHGVFEKVPVLGKWIEKHNDLLFNEYIPRLKWDTWQRINRRNMARYQKEIASGEVTADDVAYLSSKQTNAAFGHQNYVDLGRNATVQHVLRLFALAPDFLEARARFSGQAAQGVVSKVGREQLEALSLLAGIFYVGARIGNKLSDDDWHFEEPFRIRYGNRWYGMRSVPEDLWRAFNDTRVFAYNRLNPVFGRPTMELLSGVNYRGEKIPASEVFKNILVSGIPIQMREAPGLRSLTETQRNTTITAWEQFLSAMGLQVSRYSPLNQTYKLATKWRKAQGEKEAPTTYPVSKYQPLRYALEDHDLTRAADELAKLTEGGKVPLTKIAQGFHVSLHRPFSGSLANEGKFVASLTPDQKALYKEAIAQRSRVWREFTNAEQEYHNRLKEGR